MLLLSFASFISHRQLSLIFLYRALFFCFSTVVHGRAQSFQEHSHTTNYSTLEASLSYENLTEMLRSIQATF